MGSGYLDLCSRGAEHSLRFRRAGLRFVKAIDIDPCRAERRD